MHVTEEWRRDHLKALLRELESCKRQGLGERVNAINAELAKWGHEAAPKQKRAATR